MKIARESKITWKIFNPPTTLIFSPAAPPSSRFRRAGRKDRQLGGFLVFRSLRALKGRGRIKILYGYFYLDIIGNGLYQPDFFCWRFNFISKRKNIK